MRRAFRVCLFKMPAASMDTFGVGLRLITHIKIWGLDVWHGCANLISDFRYAKYLRSKIGYYPSGISKNSTAMNSSTRDIP